jgi:hypothetical protein
MRVTGSASRSLARCLIIVAAGVTCGLAQQPPRLEPKKKVGRIKYSIPGGRRGESCSADRKALFQIAAVYMENNFRTAETSPHLFWYSSGPIERACVPQFTLMCDQREQPKGVICPLGEKPIEIRQPRPGEDGIHAVKFGATPVRLQPGVLYRWYISAGDPVEPRSKDDVDGSLISLATCGPGQDRCWYDEFADLEEHYSEKKRAEYLAKAAEAGFPERSAASGPR